MLTAISRYGARVYERTQQLIADVERRGQLIEGPHVAAFEAAFAERLGVPAAVSASYGRMAFLYLLKALALPPGSEIIFPSLTFWVVPELARVAGLRPVFADVDPDTFTLDPRAFERAISDRTRAVVPTHLWGMACDMDAILAVAERHRLAVIEDCAHALGAHYRGRPVGTLGHAGFFSFQTFKPLNTYGGGMAVSTDADLIARAAALARAEPFPSEARIRKKLFIGRVERIAIRPRPFTSTLYPALVVSSFFHTTPDVYLWEKVRSLSPLPEAYTERYSNVQAALGLASLDSLDGWTAATQAHARRLDERLARVPGVRTPRVPADRDHVYYQYCIYAPDRAALVRHCLYRGVDLETLHVDVCPRLELFAGERRLESPGAERAADAVQVPVYASLTDAQIERIADVVEHAFERKAERGSLKPAA